MWIYDRNLEKVILTNFFSILDAFVNLATRGRIASRNTSHVHHHHVRTADHADKQTNIPTNVNVHQVSVSSLFLEYFYYTVVLNLRVQYNLFITSLVLHHQMDFTLNYKSYVLVKRVYWVMCNESILIDFSALHIHFLSFFHLLYALIVDRRVVFYIKRVDIKINCFCLEIPCQMFVCWEKLF